MSDQEPRSNHINAAITGNVSGQVAIGHNISQVRTSVSAPISESELAGLRQMLNELRTQIVTQAPSDKREAALERAAELEEAIAGEKPNLSTIEYVKQWFARHVPKLAGAVSSIVIHPVVGKLVAAAGDALSEEFRRRFGQSG